ncbi:MAG: hypothetical protein C4586_05890 [Anaerolineaceae bacterium]|nr:MAG: hypothetical protein C4586_05890 [Anaerolineaceae bacterium]
MDNSALVHVDQLLSGISIKYRNTNFVAMEVFPELQVAKDSDKYRIYDRNFRLPETARANKAEAREHSFAVSTGTYTLEEHALVDYITDRDKSNYDLSDLRADTTEELTDKILQRMEKSVADLFTSTSWSQNVSLSAAQQWSSDTTTSNPIPQMDTAGTVVMENSGYEKNIGIIPHRAMIAAKNHTSIIDRIKYTSVDITPAMLAGLFDLPKLLVPKAVIDTAAEGVASSISPLWGDNVFVGYRAERAGPLKPSAGYVFRSNKALVKSWREEKRSADAIEVGMLYQAKVVASLAGYLIKDTLA